MKDNYIFRTGDKPCAAEIGGKAAALARLQGCGPLIPEWFVLLPQAFDAGVSETDRQVLAECRDQAAAERILAELRLTPAALQELREALAQLAPAGEPLAVRSSAMDEDSHAHSFAGQYETFLSVPPDEVPGKVLGVWRSGFSARARAYRELHRLPPAPRPPAVLIQRMIVAEAAGVGFGAEPVSGREDLAVVSAVRGPGVTLVNGDRDADTWQVDGSDKIVLRQLVNDVPALDDAQVRAVAQLIRRTGALLGRPQDIEWAIADGSLYLLQSRPITSLHHDGEVNIWDNSNIVESYSGVTTPLTFSFAQRAYEGVYRQFCRMLSVSRAKIEAHDTTFRHMLGLVRGRIYYNLLNWYRVLALLPGFTVNRRFMEQMMGVTEELPAEILARLNHASLTARATDSLNLFFSAASLVANHFLLPRKIRRFRARLNDALAPPDKPLEAMTAQELAAHFDGLETKLLTRWDAPLLNDFFAMIHYGVLRRLITRWTPDATGTLQNGLLCGGGGMISAEPAQRIRELASLASADSGFVQLLCTGQLPEILDRMKAVPGFETACRGYLDRFGERCLEELKLESLTLHDDPLMLLRSVGQLARSPARDTEGLSDEDPDRLRRSAEARVHEALAGHPLRRWIFHWTLRQARARVRDRENLRFERTRLFGRVRRIFVELGRRLQAAGHLLEARHIFFLELGEVLDFIGGRAPDNLKTLVVCRQAEFARYRAEAPPPNRFTTFGNSRQGPTPPAGVPPLPRGSAGEARIGIGCCPGRVRGRVRKVVDPRHALIHPGEILVAERTDPGWILLFPFAAGLLVERGSLLSHSAIVARELHIPTVVSVEGLTAWLQDGDEVAFDGGTGRIRRIAEAGPIRVATPFADPMEREWASSHRADPIVPTLAS